MRLRASMVQKYAAAVLEFAEAGDKQPLLRSTTRRGLGQTTRRLLAISKSALEGRTAAHLSAESLNLVQQLPHAVVASRLPRPAYDVLQMVASACVAALVPAAHISFALALLLLWSVAGGMVVVLAAPLLYAAMLAGLAAALVCGKNLLFPHRMQPGVYPLYGGTYLR